MIKSVKVFHKHAKWPPSDLTPWTLTLVEPLCLVSFQPISHYLL